MRLEPRSRGRGERAQPNGRLDSMFELRVACEVLMVVGEVLSSRECSPRPSWQQQQQWSRAWKGQHRAARERGQVGAPSP